MARNELLVLAVLAVLYGFAAAAEDEIVIRLKESIGVIPDEAESKLTGFALEHRESHMKELMEASGTEMEYRYSVLQVLVIFHSSKVITVVDGPLNNYPIFAITVVRMYADLLLSGSWARYRHHELERSEPRGSMHENQGEAER